MDFPFYGVDGLSDVNIVVCSVCKPLLWVFLLLVMRGDDAVVHELVAERAEFFPIDS